MGSALGSDAAATTGAVVTVNVNGALLAVALAESVTVNMSPVAVVAVAESVPEMAPVDGFSDELGGSVPAVRAQFVYGGVPPVAPRVVPG